GVDGAVINRPYGRMSVTVGADLATKSSGVDVPEEIRLPRSLWIVAALNSSDRSVAPIDAALRRRFSIIRVEPDYKLLASHFGIIVPNGSTVPPHIDQWTVDDVLRLAVFFLRASNDR